MTTMATQSGSIFDVASLTSGVNSNCASYSCFMKMSKKFRLDAQSWAQSYLQDTLNYPDDKIASILDCNAKILLFYFQQHYLVAV